jgi:BirA family biotin operon repressor/biotin-[acetyl-CoA-carboxylase] ligase
VSRRDDVLAALGAAAPGPVSGEMLARQLGVSRVAVAKHVAALRAAGYEIVAAPGSGYRLLGASDVPLPQRVRALLAEEFWTRIVGYDETGSTNDDARALAREGAPEGTAVIAARQSAGRGRLGRTWSSPAGGAYVSCVLRPAVPLADVPSLGHAIAVGAARGLSAIGVEVGLKWPNDVMLDGGKLAGILLETSAETDRVDWVVAGIGLNVRRAAEAPPGAAFVSDVLPGAERSRVAAAVLDGIAAAYRDWVAGGFAALRVEYLDRFTLVGREVTVSDVTGRALAAGTVSGVDGRGNLLLDTADGSVSLVAGEVTLRI